MMNRLVVCTLLLVFCLCLPLMGNETAEKYFPATLDSYWVYEDEDGNELKRTVIEGEEIAGEIYHAFSYEPELENAKDFEYYIHTTLFKIDDKGIKFQIGEEVAETYKKRLTSEMKFSMDEEMNRMSSRGGAIPKYDFDIKVNAKDNFFMFPTSVKTDVEWESMRIKPTITVTMKMTGLQKSTETDPELAGHSMISTIYFTIIETGKVLGTENVDTPAGSFEECLKIEYRTKTVMPFTELMPGPTAGESVTTLWLAPNVGIVKFRKEAELPLIRENPNVDTTTEVKTLELKKYEIKTQKAVTE